MIDLRGGQVVRAEAGRREAYAPIRTPLASGAAPADIAHAMLAACPSDTLYVADLDAIVAGHEPDYSSLAAIRTACPGTRIWLDAGFSERERVEHFLASGLGVPVLGSESQRDAALVEAYRHACVLSLDTRDGERMGPDALHASAQAWPADVIVMTLGRVGVDAGPDLAAIAAVRALSPQVRLYAAGGVRDRADLDRLAAAGVTGALVASAIHARRLP